MATDDDFFEDEDDKPAPPADDKDAIITRLQRQRDKLKADQDKIRKEAFEEATKSFERKNKALEVGGGLGLKPRAIESFLKENPEGDITPEVITPWAEEYGFPVKATEPEQTEAPAEAKPPAAASFHAGSGSPAGAEVYTPGQVFEMAKSDPGIWDRLRPDQIKQE